jgi:hypothetical protein
MIGEKQEIVDVIGREYLGLFTRHLASNQLFKSILDQLSLTATETLCQTLCIGLTQKLYSL